MNIRHFTVALTLAGAALAPALAATSVGVSVSVVQPGVYGRIDIGTAPRPAIIYAQPVIYAPPRVAVAPAPVYLYVPPGHRKHWGKHCGRYGACGVPVYFVPDRWVRVRYDEHHHHGRH